jgi:hypothetical protein
MSDDGLSREEVERIVEELMRQSAEERKRSLSSENSFIKFLKDAGLFWIFQKIGKLFDWILEIFT